MQTTSIKQIDNNKSAPHSGKTSKTTESDRARIKRLVKQFTGRSLTGTDLKTITHRIDGYMRKFLNLYRPVPRVWSVDDPKDGQFIYRYQIRCEPFNTDGGMRFGTTENPDIIVFKMVGHLMCRFMVEQQRILNLQALHKNFVATIDRLEPDPQGEIVICFQFHADAIPYFTRQTAA